CQQTALALALARDEWGELWSPWRLRPPPPWLGGSGPPARRHPGENKAPLLAPHRPPAPIAPLPRAVERLGKRRHEVANQITRAGSSIALNIREGAERRGKDREHLWRIAAGSAAEVDEALHVARAWGYADAALVGPAQSLASRVLALLWRLAPPRR